MPIVYAQHRLPALQKIRLSDYVKIALAVRAGHEDEAEAAGAAHVQHVRREIVSHASCADPTAPKRAKYDQISEIDASVLIVRSAAIQTVCK
jgi:hypothetical protein